MPLHGHSLLAGSLGKPGLHPFRGFNPATGQALEPDYFEASPEEVNGAAQAASAAFAVYRAEPPATRARLLEAIASGIEALGEPLIERAHQETGLPHARLTGERARTCGQLRLFAQLVTEGSWVDARIDSALPERQPLPRPDLRRILQPIGPVAVFGSSNFPLAFSVAGGDTASALAAGCSVLVKAHGAHPGTSELVGQVIVAALAACGLPAGLFSLLHGPGQTVGVQLVRHPAVAAVGFTGSQAAGRALFDAAATRPNPIPVFAEMSSLNPVFILPGALRERGTAVAQGLAGSMNLGVGQFCTKPGLVFVQQSSDSAAFLEHLAAAIQAAPTGTMLTPGIRTAFEAERAKIVAVPGVNFLAAGSRSPDAHKTEARPAVAVTYSATFRAHPDLATEAFGPFTLVVLADSPADLVGCAESLGGQLTATLQGQSSDWSGVAPLLAALETRVGRVLINGFPTGVEVAPAMNHGGPYPATSDARFTSVGTAAILRFARPICYQAFPDALLPAGLQNQNPLNLLRLVNGMPTREPV